MNTISASLKRHSVSIGVALFLTLEVAYYLLVRVPARQAQLQTRYFRVLEQIGKNLVDRRDVYQKRGEVMLRSIVNGLVPGTADTVQLRALSNWRLQRDLQAAGRRENSRADSLPEQNLPRFDSLQILPRSQAFEMIAWKPETHELSFGYRSSLFDAIPGAAFNSKKSK